MFLFTLRVRCVCVRARVSARVHVRFSVFFHLDVEFVCAFLLFRYSRFEPFAWWACVFSLHVVDAFHRSVDALLLRGVAVVLAAVNAFEYRYLSQGNLHCLNWTNVNNKKKR